jgi:hypothetical protein
MIAAVVGVLPERDNTLVICMPTGETARVKGWAVTDAGTVHAVIVDHDGQASIYTGEIVALDHSVVCR